MKTADTAAPLCYTVAQCAEQIGVSFDTVIRWIEDGHLATFCPPGKQIGDSQPGPKGLKIFRSDWENFLRARTMTGARTSSAAPSSSSASSTRPRTSSAPTDQVTGTDGISRRKRRPRGPQV